MLQAPSGQTFEFNGPTSRALMATRALRTSAYTLDHSATNGSLPDNGFGGAAPQFAIAELGG